MASNISVSPPVHRLQPGEQLDRSAFSLKVPVVGLRIPAARTTDITRSSEFKRQLLKLPKVKTVLQENGDDEFRVILLDYSTQDAMPQDLVELAQTNNYDIVQHGIDLEYDYWTADEILRSSLPEDLLEDMPTAFTITGHLAHYNLRDEYLPYKHLIGQVTLDKNKALRTVVNKTDNIDTTFRFFKMETIAGESDTVVEVNESGCRFKFDFAKVYWNSRLGTEHERLVSLFSSGDLIADVFAGVGPFAIPAARKNCLVLANDLNPSSTEYLSRNSIDNKVEDRVRVTTMDGRAFIKHAVQEAIDHPFENILPLQSSSQRAKQARLKLPPPDPLPVQRTIKHFVMNLPATALEFLDAFRPAFRSATNQELYNTNGMPTIHCHCFTRELEKENAEVDILKRAEEALGMSIANPSFHYVRRVAPNKDMYCLSFVLPRTIMQ
ncbi:tRNA (guanine(37)-N1)-methyltransferase {ECO:0000255/HAMAP-Rule:MF_03152} {ECO:0000255/HAMAP-Rule:MF_03152}; AltName: Full=M1G-methyltransferase {ECO:0000255/HAMAP-Rule:MF_03152}; AltName: Full=tRNA [GM37] methyltransferase {ECO:0000255/HAMAP-Rule:MF_03152}; AltName: Full=tRNA methyltransferase 5 {ECO:0000255/HAMAP-Rule:MF_03152} [Serendipita indica DSM 11827]|nr:tRNA (guanine(37)-N1)-methyltransferase {ECO:0000255/HAMAP-Rule:MF_03152} {ECO:0000255/HAMAP-Rule:MF_03152}; AltName: Full=M1G-methyltransferase {ECO:0000255/HAMAP-Rule:MF_03152}; AltName: Full=tRNA [GM37] methyltransferase {ECO:0000255/HAMAP-Rule:MF_03152}; AltName: Full=tRNA methyltransferase 5 {ECO:0000255/HAMAP-Rule:MF_03152} [Serendipita indica DSM 11827]